MRTICSRSASLFVTLLFLPMILVAQWVQNSGHSGGSVTTLAVSGSDLYAVINGEVVLSTK